MTQLEEKNLSITTMAVIRMASTLTASLAGKKRKYVPEFRWLSGASAVASRFIRK